MPKAEAGIPVIDSANLVQSVIQAISWIQQLQQMQQQILQAQSQIDAITGSRNMASLFNNLALAGVVPSDVNAVYGAIRQWWDRRLDAGGAHHPQQSHDL